MFIKTKYEAPGDQAAAYPGISVPISCSLKDNPEMHWNCTYLRAHSVIYTIQECVLIHK